MKKDSAPSFAWSQPAPGARRDSPAGSHAPPTKRTGRFSLLKVLWARYRFWEPWVFIKMAVFEAYSLLKYGRCHVKYLFAVENAELDLGDKRSGYATIYSPTPFLFLHDSFRLLGGAPAGKTFIDLGCGAGRVLLHALQFPFARIIGVELSANLIDLARTNVANTLRRRPPPHPPVEFHHGDLLHFPFPNEDLVLFLYEPFDAEPAPMRALLKELDARVQRDIHVIYAGPHNSALFVEDGFIELHRRANKFNRGFCILHRPAGTPAGRPALPGTPSV